MSPKTTGEWEVEDIINDLKAGITEPGEDRRTLGTCAYHDPNSRAQVWTVRKLADTKGALDELRGMMGKLHEKMDALGKSPTKLLSLSNGKFKVNFTGFGATEIALIVIVGIMAWNMWAVRRVRLDLDEKIPNVGRVAAMEKQRGQ